MIWFIATKKSTKSEICDLRRTIAFRTRRVWDGLLISADPWASKFALHTMLDAAVVIPCEVLESDPRSIGYWRNILKHRNGANCSCCFSIDDDHLVQSRYTASHFCEHTQHHLTTSLQISQIWCINKGAQAALNVQFASQKYPVQRSLSYSDKQPKKSSSDNNIRRIQTNKMMHFFSIIALTSTLCATALAGPLSPAEQGHKKMLLPRQDGCVCQVE